ncbi:MAG: hypothetical protein ACOYIB_08785 [Desulfosporosinus sp.]|jgi:hypothetical protein
MPLQSGPLNPASPLVLPQIPSSSTRGYSGPKAKDTWDYKAKHSVPLLKFSPVGAGLVALTVFFFIVFFSTMLLKNVTLATLGITVTIGTVGIITLIILLLFLF